MVTVSVYGGNSDGTELVFTMFTGPDGLDYTSLFDFNGKGGGDVFCGQYERQTETDEDLYSSLKRSAGTYAGAFT